MRISVSIPSEQLATIDEAAELAGETRSAYLTRAALSRADGGGQPLSRAQRTALAAALMAAVRGL